MMHMTAVAARLAHISIASSIAGFSAQLSWLDDQVPQQAQREWQQEKKHSGSPNTLLQTIHMGSCDDIQRLCQQAEAAAVSVGCLDVLLSAAEYWQPAAVDVLAGLPAASKLHSGIVCGWCKPPSRQLNSALLWKLVRLRQQQQQQQASTAAAAVVDDSTEDTADADNACKQQPPGLGLLSVPAVQSSINPKGVKSLLKAALRAHTTAWVQQLCQLPAAVRLPLGAAQQLLLLAVQQHASPYAAAAGSNASLQCICQLRPVQQLDSSCVQPAVQAAVQLVDSGALSVLVELLPAVQQLESGDVQQLLLCAIKHRGASNETAGLLLVELCKLLACQQFDAGESPLGMVLGWMLLQDACCCRNIEWRKEEENNETKHSS
jgi:glutaredoxin